jgi:hypothetical protein
VRKTPVSINPYLIMTAKQQTNDNIIITAQQETMAQFIENNKYDHEYY